MSLVNSSIPDEILLALKTTPDALGSRIRFAASVKLYEMGQLLSGAAARLAEAIFPQPLGGLWREHVRPKRRRSALRSREAICDTSQIQYLHQVDLLHLRPQFYTRIVVPPAVVDELNQRQSDWH
jgi:hypothetical protein